MELPWMQMTLLTSNGFWIEQPRGLRNTVSKEWIVA
ncbi:hypothetical protein GCK32_008005 [Trichostrongylus colubriformis]|uniref:Uncharacterized protein n=1 Tax=Trichostrongylus colubriformis TaxID=6319 RepID=A0AAN8FX30_TRICO